MVDIDPIDPRTDNVRNDSNQQEQHILVGKPTLFSQTSGAFYFYDFSRAEPQSQDSKKSPKS